MSISHFDQIQEPIHAVRQVQERQVFQPTSKLHSHQTSSKIHKANKWLSCCTLLLLNPGARAQLGCDPPRAGQCCPCVYSTPIISALGGGWDVARTCRVCTAAAAQPAQLPASLGKHTFVCWDSPGSAAAASLSCPETVLGDDNNSQLLVKVINIVEIFLLLLTPALGSS